MTELLQIVLLHMCCFVFVQVKDLFKELKVDASVVELDLIGKN